MSKITIYSIQRQKKYIYDLHFEHGVHCIYSSWWNKRVFITEENSLPFRKTFYLNCQSVNLDPWKFKTPPDTLFTNRVASGNTSEVRSTFSVFHCIILHLSFFNKPYTKYVCAFVSRCVTYTWGKTGSGNMFALDFSSAFNF